MCADRGEVLDDVLGVPVCLDKLSLATVSWPVTRQVNWASWKSRAEESGAALWLRLFRLWQDGLFEQRVRGAFRLAFVGREEGGKLGAAYDVEGGGRSLGVCVPRCSGG